MKSKSIFIAVMACGLIALTAVSTAATYTPGSSGDPVVTKSYVDSRVADLKALIGQNSGGNAASYMPLQIASGKTLLGAEGSEIILRSGEATGIDNGANGISDITAGKDLRTGDAVSLNHLILIPREDGRGIKATTEIWVLIKGSYQIK